jgi:hypothetical protein
MSTYAPRISLENDSKGFVVGGELDTAMADFAATAVRADAVDPLITELVRLRCAQVHDCRLCGSLRLTEALDRGLDEEMAEKIARYETAGFDPAAVAALRLADAIILAPAKADAELREELSRHFTSTQIAELCFDVMKWSHQKVLVSLRLESPPWDETAELSFDAAGDPVIGGPVSSRAATAG